MKLPDKIRLTCSLTFVLFCFLVNVFGGARLLRGAEHVSVVVSCFFDFLGGSR